MPTVVERKWHGAKVYDLDAIGKPLTPKMADDLRAGRASPHLIARGLAQNPESFIPPRADDDPFPLTPEGARYRALLGTIPNEHVKVIRSYGRVVGREYDTRYCRSCHAFVDVRLIAWDLYDWTSDLGENIVCINCATKETP